MPVEGRSCVRAGERRCRAARRRRGTRGFTLIELLIVIVIIAILAAIAIPVYLGQRDRAKDSAVRVGVHDISVGVLCYVVEDGLAPAAVDRTTLGAYVDDWPKNPWTGAPMADSAAAGDYTYTRMDAGHAFTLTGHGDDGSDVISVP